MDCLTCVIDCAINIQVQFNHYHVPFLLLFHFNLSPWLTAYLGPAAGYVFTRLIQFVSAGLASEANADPAQIYEFLQTTKFPTLIPCYSCEIACCR